jgi:uncharacterized protein (DUF2062 family)
LDSFRQKLIAFLKIGITPEKLAFCIALGCAFGMIPAIGTTTILCALTAFILRLNLAAILAVNYFVYPIQLALLLPFIRAGEWLFGSEHLDLSADLIQRMMKEDLLKAAVSLGPTMIHALLAWLLIAPIIAVVIFFIMRPLLRRLPVERFAAGS